MTSRFSRRTHLALLVTSMFGPLAMSARAADQVDFLSLLKQLPNLDNLAQYPGATVGTGQASSTCPAEFTTDWYCNTDYDNFSGSEIDFGRQEEVLADINGPGVITRLWLGGPVHNNGNIRFYFDNQTKPAIVANLNTLMTGKSFVHKPFVYQAGPFLQSVPAPGGLNLYLPIPFAKHVKVTFDGGTNPDFWYNLEYRRFPAGTSVKTFAITDYTDHPDVVNAVAAKLSTITNPNTTNDVYHSKAVSTLIDGSIPAGQSVTIDLPGGAHAIRLLQASMQGATEAQLRGLTLSMTFDGEQTVASPIGDFFGSGLGLNPGTTQTQSVGADGSMSSRWTMPYENSASVTLTNTTSSAIPLLLSAEIGDWTWTSTSMHFHAYYKDTGPYIATNQDMRFLDVFGTGVYVGDNETVNQTPVNSNFDWWGEGDERIYVDTSTFPTHWGTGSEDYYGYSYGHTFPFEAPWDSQVRVAPPAGTDNYNGVTVLNRTRLLDTIPFSNHLRFDFESWNWNVANTVQFQHVAFFYALPGATVVPVSIVSGMTYTLQSKISGWNLDVVDGSTSPGALLQDYLPDGSDAQRFTVADAGGGAFTLQNVLSGLYLTDPGDSQGDAVQLQQDTLDGTCDQLWSFTPTSDDYVTVTNRCSGKNMDVYLGATTPADQINQYHVNGSDAQDWRFNLSP